MQVHVSTGIRPNKRTALVHHVFKRKFTEQSWNTKHGGAWKLLTEEEKKIFHIMNTRKITPSPLSKQETEINVASFKETMSYLSISMAIRHWGETMINIYIDKWASSEG